MATQPLPMKRIPKRVMLHPGHTRLDDAPIPAAQREALKKLGFISVEQVLSASKVVKSKLDNYLKTDVRQMFASVPQPVIPQLPMKAQIAEYRFGVRLERPVTAVMPRLDLAGAQYTPLTRTAPAPSAGPLGSTPDVNLISEMPPVRDQGNRGTCVAHAAVAAMEHYLTRAGAIDLSEQFLYWNCKNHDGRPQSPGTLLAVAMPLLFTDGCCLETVWPYNPNPVPGNEGQGPPPAPAAADAATRKAPAANQLSPQSVSAIKNGLAAGRCVAVSVVVYDYCWTTPEIRSSGSVTMPFPGDTSNEGHAICLVGYDDSKQLFTFRNSWGDSWGDAGYGYLPYAYVLDPNLASDFWVILAES